MATYVYETIPQDPSETPERFEIRQSMSEDALTAHPETGHPIRRVITGGFGYMSSGASGVESSHAPSSCCAQGGCGCR